MVINIHLCSKILACVKSGHAYCPVDVNTQIDRAEDIIATVKNQSLEEISLVHPDVNSFWS